MPRVAIAVLPAILFVAGCSDSSLPPETDATKGREVLTTVLEAWKKGTTPDELQHGSPPIVAYDPDWKAGYKLTNYTLDPTDKRVGVDLLVSVKLTMTKDGEKPVEKTVNFSVAIGSQTVVLRQT
jgi:hypothetical protein